MMTFAMVGSIVTAPSIAKLGPPALLVVPIMALIVMGPTVAVVCELATAWPHDGGVYLWVREAFGGRIGFAAMVWQWLVNMIVLPTALAYVASAAAYGFDPALAVNPLYLLGVVVVFVWGATGLNMFGIHDLGILVAIGIVIAGVVPGVVLVGLALANVAGAGAIANPINWASVVPDLKNPSNFSLAIAAAQAFLGMEISAVFVRRLTRPTRDLPRALLFGGVLAFSLTFVATLAIVIAVPRQQLDIVSGIMQAFQSLASTLGLEWVVLVIALLITIGWVGKIGNILIGPATGLLASARYGHLPDFFTKLTPRGVPRNLLLCQAIFVTVLSLLFVLVPGVQDAYWMLVAMVVVVYMLMYALMFLAAVRLRFSRPEVPRPFSIPGGRFGMSVVAGIGLVVSLTIMVVALIPPTQLGAGTPITYYSVVGGGAVVALLLPFFLDRSKGKGPPSTRAGGAAALGVGGREVFLDDSDSEVAGSDEDA
jgi:glutamate:GABA antiporter